MSPHRFPYRLLLSRLEMRDDIFDSEIFMNFTHFLNFSKTFFKIFSEINNLQFTLYLNYNRLIKLT